MSPHSHRTSKVPVPIRNDATHTNHTQAPKPKMNIFTRHPTAPVAPAKSSQNAESKPLTSRTSWSILPLKAKAATFPSLLPRPKASSSSPTPTSSGRSSTTTLVNQEIEDTKLSLAEEWAMAPQWRRDAAKRRVRDMRIRLGIIKVKKEEEEGIEMQELQREERREELRFKRRNEQR